MSNTNKDMFVYGLSLRKAYPTITEDQMKAALEARFIGGKDVLSLCQVGCVCNPLVDVMALLTIVVNSVRKMFIQKIEAFHRVQEQINVAVAALMAVR